MKKYTPCFLEAVDYKTAQRWLDDMAGKGWELERCNRIFATFRKVENRTVRHFADLCPRWEDREDYLRLCADAGWEQVSKVNGMDLFRAQPGREVTPIQSDKGLEGKRYFRKKLVVEFFLYIVTFLLLVVLVPWLFSMQTDWRVQLITSAAAQITALSFTLFTLHLLWTLGHYIALSLRYRREGEVPRAALTLCRARVALYWVAWLLYLVGQVLIPFSNLLAGRPVSVGLATPAAADWARVEEAPVPTLEELGAGEEETFLLYLDRPRSFLTEGWDYTQCAGEDAIWCERYTCISEHVARMLVHALRESKERSGPAGYGMLQFSPQPLTGADESWTAREGTFVLIRKGREVAFVGWRTGEDTEAITEEAVWPEVLAALHWEEN